MDRYQILLRPPQGPYETREERQHRLIKEKIAQEVSKQKQICCICGALGGCKHTTGRGYPANQATRRQLMTSYSMTVDPLVAQAIDTGYRYRL
jgi:hypothetical protein